MANKNGNDWGWNSLWMDLTPGKPKAKSSKRGRTTTGGTTQNPTTNKERLDRQKAAILKRKKSGAAAKAAARRKASAAAAQATPVRLRGGQAKSDPMPHGIRKKKKKSTPGHSTRGSSRGPLGGSW